MQWIPRHKCLASVAALACALTVGSSVWVSTLQGAKTSDAAARSTFRFGEFRPRQGDRIAYFGDSLTQENIYPVMIEHHYRLVHPELQLSFASFGVRGETSLDAQARIDTQLVPYNPTVVIVEFGTNDTYYVANWQSDDAKRRYLNFTQNYTTLLDLMKKKIPEARIILITTTIVDTVTLPELFDLPLEGINDVLYHYSAFIRSAGKARDLPVVDIYNPMLRAMLAGRRQSPPLVVMPDGVHPSVGGYYYLASTILEQFGERRFTAK